MPDKELLELSQLQWERAEEIIGYIPAYLELGDYNSAVNRAYYACFHAMKAVELLDGFDSKKHSGVVAFFRKNYIREGVFDPIVSKQIGLLQDAREDSDYNILIRFSLETAQMQFQNAKAFLAAVRPYLIRRYASEEAIQENHCL